MILIAFGANLSGEYGAPEAAWPAVYRVLAERGVHVISSSSLWLSAPVPVSDQPFYRNGVMSVESDSKPLALLALLHEIEVLFGRDRAVDVPNAARALDLDLLAYGDVVSSVGVSLPHPRLHERAFVLYPLREIAPDWVHPVLDLSVLEMIEALPEGQDIERIEAGLGQ